MFLCEANLGYGESLHVVGNCPILGMWKISKSIELFTTADTFIYYNLLDILHGKQIVIFI